MTPPRHPISILRALLTVLISVVVGSAIGIYVGVKAPKTYPATSVILNPGYASHPTSITRFRAELTTYDLDLNSRWGTSFEQAANKVADLVELKPVPEGLKVSVILPQYSDASRIVRSVSTDLGSPEHEAALAAKWKTFSDITREEGKDLGDLAKLELLLHDQARGEGFESYAVALEETAKGSEKAIALTHTEDFSRRLTGRQELMKKLGFDLPHGSSILSAGNTVKSLMPEVEVPGYAKLAVPVGRFSGLAIGGLLVLALLRWKPGFMRPAPRKQAPAPAWAKTPSTTSESNDDPW